MIKNLISLTLCLAFIFTLSACGDAEKPAVNPDSSIPYSAENSSSEDTSSVNPWIEKLESWEMKLVNKWEPLTEGFKPELASINSKYARGGRTDYKFDARAVNALHDMCEASIRDGVNLFIISPWRANSVQEGLFNRELAEVKAANPNLSQKEAEAKAATEVAAPWTSEHQLGLAVDFNSVEQSFDKTAEYKWLSENAHKYGFILRYPKNKEKETAVIYEPWHYRYVGVENAKEIKDSGLCLEEFIEQKKTS